MTSAARTFARATGAFALLLALVIVWPKPWILLVAHTTAPVIDAVTPWAQHVSVEVVDSLLVITGDLVFPGVLDDGSPMPAISGNWRQSALGYVAVLAVALTAWAIPSVAWRRRALDLPLALTLAILWAALALTAEIQRAALESIGSGALAHIAMADLPQNHELLSALQRRLSGLRWVCAFLHAGGRLGIALLAGFAAYGWGAFSFPAIAGRGNSSGLTPVTHTEESGNIRNGHS